MRFSGFEDWLSDLLDRRPVRWLLRTLALFLLFGLAVRWWQGWK